MRRMGFLGFNGMTPVFRNKAGDQGGGDGSGGGAGAEGDAGSDDGGGEGDDDSGAGDDDDVDLDPANKDPSYVKVSEKLRDLKMKNRKLEAENARRRKEVTPYRDKNGNLVDPKEFRQYQADKKAAEQKRLEERGEWEKLREEDKEALTAEQEKNKQLIGSWNRERIGRSLLEAAMPLEPLTQSVDIGPDEDECQLVRLYAGQFKVDEETKRVVHAKRLNKAGKPLSPREFLEEMKAGPGANHFKSNVQSGSGEGSGDDGKGDDGTVRIKRSLEPMERQRQYSKATADKKKVVFID